MQTKLMVKVLSVALLGVAGSAAAATPDWLKKLASAPVPAQQPDVAAVQLLSEVELVVAADGNMLKRVRSAVRILRNEGRPRAVMEAPQDSWHSVKQIHGWLVPAQGKPVELHTKDAIETSLVDVEGSEVITDLRLKVLQFSNAVAGDVVGFEYEVAVRPLEMADTFGFQDTIPVREARYTVTLPTGWRMLPTWINHAGVESAGAASQQWRWTLKDVPAVQVEAGMPSLRSVAGHLFVSFSPPGKTPQLSTWSGIGGWFVELAKDRRVASDAIRGKVAELVAGARSDLDKMRALAGFVQRDVRYVGIQLGIGGFQPHAATDVFRHRYGDCKDKATLLGVMLAEIGIESMAVIINSERTRVRADNPPSLQFNHVIIAIKLPRSLQDPALLAIEGSGDDRLLYFDPTDELTPFGRIRGELQGNVGLMALADNSRLVTLPRLLPDQSGVRRTARLALNEQGLLTGEIKERITGQEALLQRGYLRSATRESDLAKVVEARLAESLASFQLAGATPRNREASELPLEWDYRISAASYARRSGDLLMVRPRVLGVFAHSLPGEDRKRVHDLVLVETRMSQDEFVIDLPAGYVVDSMPQPVVLDSGFAVYRSRTEVNGGQLKYTRSFEVRDLLVPAARVEDFRRMNGEIARDERAVVVLRKAGS